MYMFFLGQLRTQCPMLLIGPHLKKLKKYYLICVKFPFCPQNISRASQYLVDGQCSLIDFFSMKSQLESQLVAVEVLAQPILLVQHHQL